MKKIYVQLTFALLSLLNLQLRAQIAVSTSPVSNVSGTSATGGGSVSMGTLLVTVASYGICWSTKPGPTVSLSTKTVDGKGTGAFTSSLSNLSPNTTYYLRAYATALSGAVIYGNEVIFMTACSPLSKLSYLTFPFAPGQRELSFRLPLTSGATNVGVFVYYSSSATAFNAAEPTTSVPNGKAVCMQVGKPPYLSCRFVFPHTFFRTSSDGPNKRLYKSLKEKAVPNILNIDADTLVMDRNPSIIPKGKCVYYKIVKKETVNGVVVTTCSDVMKFTMPDIFNIGIAGDSYASGEGAPYTNGLGLDGGKWDDCLCHRSNKSGLVRGCKLFIHDNPNVAVKFIHRACSGAIIEDLIFCRESDNAGGLVSCANQGTLCATGVVNTRRPQLNAISADFGINADQVNMMLMGIGGNNALFGEFVKGYLLLPFNASGILEQSSVNELINEAQNNLANSSRSYDVVNANLENVINRDKRNFIKPIAAIQTYPNSTHRTGESCGCPDGLGHTATILAVATGACLRSSGLMAFVFPPAAGFACVATAAVAAVTTNISLHLPSYGGLTYENSCQWSPRQEWTLLEEKLLFPLNRTVKENASRLKWGVMDVENIMINNGLCNKSDPWKNGIGATFATQGDIFGVVHPNSKGFAQYAPIVANTISSKYEEYLLTYALCLLNGCVNFRSDGCLPSLDEQAQMELSILYANLSKLSAYEQLKPASISLSTMSVALMDSLLTSNNKAVIRNSDPYRNLINATVRSTVCGSEMAKSIIPKSIPSTVPSYPVAANGTVQTKMKKAIANYMATEEYNSIMKVIKDDYINKINDPIRAASNFEHPLDSKYNNNESIKE